MAHRCLIQVGLNCQGHTGVELVGASDDDARQEHVLQGPETSGSAGTEGQVLRCDVMWMSAQTRFRTHAAAIRMLVPKDSGQHSCTDMPSRHEDRRGEQATGEYYYLGGQVS